MNESQIFRGEPASAAAARRFATQAVAKVAPDAVESIELMVSELATNCIRHTESEFEVRVERTPDGFRIEVTDSAGGTPQLRAPAIDEPTGRGLRIIELLSDRWGIEYVPGGGKTVWFTLASAAAQACA